MVHSQKYSGSLAATFFCLCFILGGHCHAQKSLSAQQADSLYLQGNFSEAAQAFHALARQWKTEGITDSMYYYQLWEAKSHIQQYEYPQARALLKPIISGAQASTDRGLLSKVYHEIGYTYMGEGELDQALAFSKKSIDTELSRTKVDTFQLAKYYEIKGFMLMQSGEYEAAEQWVTNAHHLRQAVLDPMDKELGYSANTLYIILSALGKLQQADTVISQAWHILNHHLPQEHPHIAVLANNYSSHLIDMGDPQLAREYLLKAIASNQQGERYFPLIGNYVNLGLLYLNLNESKTAESYYQQAWEIADTLIVYPDYQRANIKDALGAVYYQQDQLDKADALFASSLAEKEELYERQSAEIAQSLYNLGLIAQAKEDWPHAQDYFIQSEKIRAKVLGPTHPKRADALYELGMMVWKHDRQKALTYWRNTLEIYQQNFGISHHHSLENQIQLARAFAEINLQDSVIHYLQLAWSGACGQPDAITDFRQLDTLSISQYHPHVLELVNFHLSRILGDGGIPQAADFHTAQRIFKKVQSWLPTFQSLYNDPALWEKVAAQIQDFYRQSALIAHRALSSESKDQAVWQNILLHCIQSSRGATIQSAFKDRQAVQFAGVPDSLVEQGQTLKQQLRFTLARQQNDVETSADLVLQQQAILQSWQELQLHLRQSYSQYYQARFETQAVSMESLQSILREQDYAVLAYLNLDSALLAVHVQADRLHSSWLPMPQAWQDSLQQYQQLLQLQKDSQRQADLGYFLYQYLWEPLALSPDSQINLLPDGPLYYLNFETLLTQKVDKKNNMRQWPWLIREHCIFYGHSLPGTMSTSSGGRGKVLGIAPGFSQDLKDNYLNKLPQQQPPDSTFLRWLRTPWSMAFVQQLQAEGWGESLTAQAATETLFLEEAPKASILHFGTHARLENEKPLYSFLALTPEPEKAQDGYLYTYELYSKPLQAQLAVLTACETGLGNYRQGEGVLSLAHAFRYAGCPSVIYSLWSIDDQHTNEIAAQFYKNLDHEMGAAQALRTAKLSYLDQAEADLQSPYYWAGLVLSGEDAHIRMNSSFSAYWMIGLGVGLLLVIGLIVVRRKIQHKP